GCDALACRMAGGRTTLVLLVLASLVVVMAIVLDRFPEVTSDLLARLTDASDHSAAGHDMKGMGGRGRHEAWARILGRDARSSVGGASCVSGAVVDDRALG